MINMNGQFLFKLGVIFFGFYIFFEFFIRHFSRDLIFCKRSGILWADFRTLIFVDAIVLE
jgi:hypothetical protein